MSNPLSYPKFQAFTDDGDFLVNGKLYSYYPGTSTVKATFSNHTRSAANANPIILDDRGEAIVYTIGPTKFVLKDADDVTIWTQDWVGEGYQGMYDAGSAGTQSALAAILTTIGTTNPAKLYLGPVTWTITSDLTIPANVTIVPDPMAKFLVKSGVTLTIMGPIEAEPIQIFSWEGTGAIDISSSPTPEVFIQWWGAVSGKTNDCTAALSKAFDSIGSQHNITFPEGIWRITSNITKGSASTYTDRRYSLRGKDRHLSTLYIDVGSTINGLYLAGAYFDIRDMSFVGPTNCCKNGLVIGSYGGCGLNMERVNLFMGAAEYALRLSGCIYGKINNIDIGHYDGLYGVAPYSCARPTNGIAFMKPLDFAAPATNEYGNNSIDLLANISGMTAGYGIYIDNAICVKIRGSVENCLWPIYVDGGAERDNQNVFEVHHLDFDDMYVLDLNVNNIYIKKAEHTTINNCACEQGPAVITNCRYTSIKNSRFESLRIMADCINTVLDNVGVANVNGPLDHNFKNEAADTVCMSPIYSIFHMGQVNQPSNPPQATNILSNAGFQRWTASAPDRWVEATGTWAIEGTIVHNSPKSAKLNTNGQASVQPTYTLNAAELAQVINQHVTFSMWLYFVGVPTTYKGLSLNLSTPPDWAGTTGYKIGDCVLDTAHTSSFRFKCVQSGTTAGSEPTWPTKISREVTDGTVIWQAIYLPDNDQTLNAADSGVWRQLAGGGFVPKNCTSATLSILLYKATAADIDYYLSRPCLTIGGWSPYHYMPGRNEFTSDIQVAVNKIYFGTAAPAASGVWYNQGDVCFRSDATTGQAAGWMCTVSGVAGAATWKAMGNLA